MIRSIRSPEVVPFLEGLIVMRTVRRHAQPRHAKPCEGRTVVVTGASAGLGRATARAFGANGARVALLARGRVGPEAAAEEVERAGGTALVVPVDMAVPAQVEAAADQVESRLGPVDVWVDAAFTSIFAPFLATRPDEYERATAVTCLGCVNGTRAALRRMLPRGHGTVVQIGSTLSEMPVPLQAAYCGAKHAVYGFTAAVRLELVHLHSGVAAAVVQLPAVNTPQFTWALSRLPRRPRPVPPVCQPEVAARAVLHAARHPRRREYRVGAATAAAVLDTGPPPDSSTGTSPVRATTPSRPTWPRPPHRTTSGLPSTVPAAGTTAPTDRSTTRPPRTRRTPRSPATRPPPERPWGRRRSWHASSWAGPARRAGPVPKDGDPS